jgi:hypothetical protein
VDLFGVQFRRKLGETGKIGEHHRHLAALAGRCRIPCR